MIKDIPLTIGQMALIAEIPRSTLRYWEKQFQEFLKPNRNKGGQRFYLEDDVQKVLRIKQLLKVDSYTVAAVRRKLVS